MPRIIPPKSFVLNNRRQIGAIREEQRQIRSQNAMLDGAQDFFVLFIPQRLEYVVPVLENCSGFSGVAGIPVGGN